MVIVQKKYLIVGGSGFVGSNLVVKLLFRGEKVIVIDNLISGEKRFIEKSLNNPNFFFLNYDISDWNKIDFDFTNIDTIVHLASNADIAAASADPSIDFWRGTYLTQCVAEFARVNKVKQIFYASGSGVYGDQGDHRVSELDLPYPNSPYGASKIAGEAILCAYAHMFGIKVRAFRFGNVVGPNQTHGVGLDFLKQLLHYNGVFHVLGDGKQSKSYIYVDDILNAIEIIEAENSNLPFDYFNISTGDEISVKEIMETCFEVANIPLDLSKIKFTGGSKGWQGDVPIVKLDNTKIRNFGWVPESNSKQSIQKSAEILWNQLKYLNSPE